MLACTWNPCPNPQWFTTPYQSFGFCWVYVLSKSFYNIIYSQSSSLIALLHSSTFGQSSFYFWDMHLALVLCLLVLLKCNIFFLHLQTSGTRKLNWFCKCVNDTFWLLKHPINNSYTSYFTRNITSHATKLFTIQITRSLKFLLN